jgi:hypothetical protein
MKREPKQRHRKQQTLAVSILTATVCADAVHPPLLLSREATTSLTLRGELTPARRAKRPVVVIVRRCELPVGGRVFLHGPILNVLVNLPPSRFGDTLALALSGHLAGVEVTTEKLMPTARAVVGVRFATGELRSARPAEMIAGIPSSQLSPPSKSARVPRQKGRRRSTSRKHA